MAPDAREPQLLHVLTDARGRDFAALDDALGDAGAALVRRACVAVRGLSPVGVETARLLLASDVGEIVVLDEPRDATVTPSDIGATSVLTEEHLGKPRARSVVDALNAPRFRPAHRASPVVRAAGPNDAHWTGDETECSDEARTFRRRMTAPDALVSAWHVDTPTLADADHTIVSAVLGNGGTHVLAAAPGLFAFARAARRPRREDEKKEDEKIKDGADDARAEEESASDSDEDARVRTSVSDRDLTGIWNERRFRDARLARAPVSLVESVVPADDDDAARLATKPERRSLLFFVTVCDANAHGLREGDGVAFIDPLAEDTDDVARGRGADETRDPLTERARRRARAVKGVVRSIASPHAFAVSIDEAELPGGGHDAARLAGRYVRQRRRRDARERPPRVSAPFGNAFANAGGGTNKRKRESTRPNETSRTDREPTTTEATEATEATNAVRGSQNVVVAPTDVRGVSSFVYGRDAATVAPAVAAARVATAFLGLGRENKNDALPGVYDVYDDDDDDSSLAIDALRRGARVAFAPCVGVAAAVAAHETLKALARVQIPLAAGAPETGAWFAHDFLELDPAFSKRVSFTGGGGKKKGKEGFGEKASEPALPAKDANVACSVRDLLGAELVREAATREVAIVGASDRCRAFAETLAQMASARASSGESTRDRSRDARSNELGDVRDVRCFPTVASVPHAYADTRLDVLIVAGVEGFEARRAADASSTRHRFSLIDAGVENHAYSAYVAAVDRTAPWSVSGARDASDSPSFPSCVVGNFPHTFPHCAQWARECFARLFVELPDRRAGWRAAWASRADEDEAGDVFVEERKPKMPTEKKRPKRPNGDRRETFFRTAEGRSMLASASLDALAFALDASSDAAALNATATLPGAADEIKNETKNAIEKKCVAWSLALFERLFVEAPRDAVRTNPPDSKTATGALFWSGTKRVPYALAFDVTDPHHATFVVAAATLRASVLVEEKTLKRTPSGAARDSLDDFATARARVLETLLETARVTRNVTVRDETRDLLKTRQTNDDGAEVSVFERSSGDEKMKTGEDDDAFSDDASRARRLADAVLDAFDDERAGSSRSSARSSGGIRRDPTAGPAFVAAAAACRARVFRVPVPRERELAAAATGARPATPAPAAFAAALAAAETYKLAQSTTAKRRSVTRSADGVVGNPPLLPAARRASESFPEGTGRTNLRCHFRCSYGSLGAHAHASASPAALETRVARTSPTTPDLRFTAWDALTFDARDGVTLAGFLAMFRETVGLEPSTVARGPALLFADFMNLAKPETAARLTTPLATLFRDAVEENAESSDATETRVALSVTACDARDEDVDVPEVWVRIR